MLQALTDGSDCSTPPCNSPGSALPYMSYPAFADSLLGKVCDLNPVRQYLYSKSMYIGSPHPKFLLWPTWANFLNPFVKVLNLRTRIQETVNLDGKKLQILTNLQ